MKIRRMQEEEEGAGSPSLIIKRGSDNPARMGEKVHANK
jgi:hypothetical protein